MLKSLDPLLNADVLYALRAMGHGDDLIICDTNFPAIPWPSKRCMESFCALTG